MIRFLKRRQKMFIGIICFMIYFMVKIPIVSSIDIGAAEPATNSEWRSQSDSQPVTTLFRTAQVDLEIFEKAPPSDEQTVNLSDKEEKTLLEQGEIYYQRGESEKAKKTFEYAKVVFPENYAAPYYLGLIYLEEGRRSDAIAEWQQYVLMDPKSEDSDKIHKYLTLLIREEAVEYAKQAVSNEDVLLQSPVNDNTVAVADFKNIGSKNVEPLCKGMAAMLIHDLSQIPDLHVMERVKLQALLKEMNLGTFGLVDQKTAFRIGKLLRSKHVITGNLKELDKENLQIISAVVDTEQMGSPDTQKTKGALNKFYHLEKEIACSIIEDLGRSCSKMPAQYYKIHTKSLMALTLYSVGLKYLDQERYDEAGEMFKKAINEDPEFDLAKDALRYTPTSSMMLMTPTQMTLALSSGGTSSTAMGFVSSPSTVAGDDDGPGFVGVTTTAVAGAAAVVGVALAAGGGGGEDAASPSPSAEPTSQANLTGVWTGAWTDSNGNNNGSISLNLTQSQGSNSVSGSATVTGTNCTFDGTVSGTISGETFQANISGSGAASVTASCTPIPTPTSMNGMLEVTSGPCAVVSGPFSTSITGGITIRW